MDIIELIKNNPKFAFTAVVAIIGVFFAYKRHSIASKKLRMDTSDFQEKKNKFKLYLADSYSVLTKKEKYLIFQIKITNQANSKNSFTGDLDIQYFNEKKDINVVKLKHQSELFNSIQHKGLNELDTNIRVNEKEIKSGWLIFKCPQHLINFRVKKFVITISDVENNSLSIDVYLIKDLVYEVENNKS
ncbi:hypothetical protein [Algibacter lectus]|uniref:DUF4352 domain-containing protein n=1 Tax=Algibacter lectus TaxID=221126 RepID=A0A4R8M7S0_9FLAO|nr:hypothetical protein [Algibacter lectus]MWW26645.1 hypothetical protein [Algibacter lectus]TDY59646.1 hypothetical protein DFQ06_3998 [Algibacter lectus]